MPDFVIQLLPMVVIQLLLLIGIVPLARRVSPNRVAVWVICSLIPVFGVFAFYFLIVRVLVAILDRLEKLKPAT